MILDRLSHASLYTSLNPLFAEGFAFIAAQAGRAPGRYPLSGGAYAMVQEFDSQPVGDEKFEAHRRFIDIQYDASGEEIMYYLCLYNEGYAQPPMPSGCEEGILKGLYKFKPGPGGKKRWGMFSFNGLERPRSGATSATRTRLTTIRPPSSESRFRRSCRHIRPNRSDRLGGGGM